MLECMEILALATRKGIRVYSVKGSWQLDHSIQSKIIERVNQQKFRPRHRSKSYETFVSFV